MSLRHHLLLLVSLLAFNGPAYLHAAPLPTTSTPAIAESTATKIEGGQTEKSASTEQIQNVYTQTALRQQALTELKQQLEKAPEQIRAAQRELEQLKTEPLPDAKHYAALSSEELEHRLASALENLSNWQKSLTEANSLVIATQTRPERAQAEIGNNQARTLDIEGQLSSGREENKPLTPERTAALNAELNLLKVTIELRRQELAGNTLLLDLGKSQRDLLNEHINRTEQETLALQSIIGDQRRTQSEQTVAELSRTTDTTAPDQILITERSENLKLSNYLLTATERLNNLTRQNLQTRQQLDSLNQADRSLEEQIAVLNGSQLLSRILYQQQRVLPKVILNKNLSDEIADLRLYQFELGQQREQISDTDSYINQLSIKNPETITSELKSSLVEVLQSRSELLKRLEPTLASLLNESITLQVNQRQLYEISQTIRKTIDEQMFWIPSNKPINLSWFKNFPNHIVQQVDSMPWALVFKQWKNGLFERPLFFLPILLLILIMVWKRQAINSRLEELNRNIGHYSKDSQLHTPLTLVLNILLALPGTLCLALCGYLLQMDGRGQNVGLGAAFYQMAQAWLVFYTTHLILAPKGMAEQHFHYPSTQVCFFRKEIRYLGIVVSLLVSVVAFARHQPASLAEDVIGCAVVLICYLLMTIILLRLLFSGPTSEHTSPFHQALGVAFSFLPLVLILVVAFGYYYTALKLTGRLIDTLYLVMVWIVLEATLVRGLSVAARQLAYQRMLAKRKASSDESPNSDSPEALEAPERNIEQVNQQSLRLVRLALLGLFLVAFYWVWSDLISVVSYLDNFTLYEFGNGDTITNISLKDFLSALVIAGITIALARNLPGLLEVLVLSRLKLAQGSAYATSTLLSYALTGIGIAATLSTLGLSWDKLQWLVAALSVGLGFGLQEIFANFVSGLIILFERPVRIGDVVTISSLSGRVSRIRIRATTITDFDRKEIIVPNKTFITSQLVNWSLTDTVTRVTIKVGVAYGSDLDLVRQLMLQAATENHRVLKEPQPEVYFLTFGESTLDHELRIHVRELGDRTPAIDEINRMIDQSFNQHGISIAFRQVDVLLKNNLNQQLVLSAVSQ